MNDLQMKDGQTACAAESYGRWLPVAIACFALAPFLPLLVPDGRVIASNEYCDYASFYLPLREFAQDEFRNGRFPLWVPWLGCGMPLHASQQAGLCYPLVTPLIVLFPVNLAMRIALFGHLALCFAGQYRLARSLGASRAAASFAAVVPTQSGYAIGHLMAGHVNHIVAFGVTPWFFLALVRHLRNATAGSTCFLAIAGAVLMLSGHPQPAYYAALFGSFWWAGSLVAGAGSRQRLRCVGWTLVAAAVAVLIGSIQLLPTLELMRDNGGATDRGTAAYATAFALDGIDLLHFFIPNLRGNPYAGIPDFPGYYFFHERAAYVGLATWVLGLFALTRSSAERWEWGAGALILLAVIISLGTSTPLFGILGKILPGLHYFRCPGRILNVVAILIGLLAANGLDAAVSGTAQISSRNADALLLALVLAANGAAIVVVNDASRFSWVAYVDFARLHLAPDFIAAAAFAVGTGLALWLCLRFGRVAPGRSSAVMLALLLADLRFNNARNFYLQDAPLETIPPEVLAREPPIRYVEVRNPAGLPASEVRYSKSVPLAIAHHRGMLGSNDGGVLPAATERLFRALEVNTGAALAASACDYEYFPVTNSWKPVADVLPRCRFIPGESVHLADISLSDLRFADLAEAAKSTVQARIVSENPQTIAIELESPAAGLLVLADTHYPGWECIVDGEQTQIESAHGVFRGVRVAAGRHRVEFKYRPASFRWGWRAGLLGVIAASLLTLVPSISRRNASAASGTVSGIRR